MKALIVFGTRPEAIKLAPVVAAMQSRMGFEPVVCVTAQHREMLDQVLEIFAIRPDIDLDLMRPGQTLAGLTAAVLDGMDEVIAVQEPDVVIVQGDTTTAFVAGLAAFYRRVPVAHVEAGLRTGRLDSPFPEELNRKMLACFARWHFVPTERARDALLREGYDADAIHVVGNTVIDALLSVRERAVDHGLAARPDLAARLDGRRFVLVTGHRRENFGSGFRQICAALDTLAAAHPEVDWVYPVHLNPQVRDVVHEQLGSRENIHLLPPVGYLDFLWLMDRADFVLTDSGGVQEEAPSLGKPVLVMRDSTERPEAVDAGVAELVGTDRDLIVARAERLLTDREHHAAMAAPQNPYGDGTAARRIVEILAEDRDRT